MMQIKRFYQSIRSFLQKMPLAPAVFGMGWNLVLALINAGISIRYTSYWYLTLAVLYFLLGIMKLTVLTWIRRKKQSASGLLKEIGTVLFLLAIVLSGMMYLTIEELHNPVKDMVVIIATAAYTFAYMIVSVINAVKAHRNRSPQMIALRDISFAGALISMISLTRSMLGTFGNAADQFSISMEAGLGFASFVLLVLLGVNLFRIAGKQKN